MPICLHLGLLLCTISYIKSSCLSKWHYKKEILGKRMKPTPLGNRVQTSTSLFIAMTAWSVDLTTQALSSTARNFFRPVSRRMQFWSQSISVQSKPCMSHQPWITRELMLHLTWSMQSTWVIFKCLHHLKLHPPYLSGIFPLYYTQPVTTWIEECKPLSVI